MIRVSRGDLELPGFARIQEYLPVVDQLLDRPDHGGCPVPEIQLDCFLSRHLSGIAHSHRDLYRFLFRDGIPVQRQLFIFKRGIAQPVAEGVQRQVRHVQVAAGERHSTAVRRRLRSPGIHPVNI